MKILLVEDDMEISAMLKSFLMTENYEVISVYQNAPDCDIGIDTLKSRVSDY